MNVVYQPVQQMECVCVRATVCISPFGDVSLCVHARLSGCGQKPTEKLYTILHLLYNHMYI